LLQEGLGEGEVKGEWAEEWEEEETLEGHVGLEEKAEGSAEVGLEEAERGKKPGIRESASGCSQSLEPPLEHCCSTRRTAGGQQ
tara:strand:+ start:151 stop:402 length:252 start_codon:yes stop_codon:yes gene_type:complete